MRNLFLFLLLLAIPWKSSSQEFTLLFAGDAMMHQSQINSAEKGINYDFSDYFSHIRYEVSQADLAIVNLEVTLAGKPYTGYPRFSAPDEYAATLQETGFDVFLTANNHILDRGSEGLTRTLTVLDSMGVHHTGVFRNKKEREQNYPLLIKKNGLSFALLDYTYGTNGFVPRAPVEVNYINKEQIAQDIEKAKAMNPDLIIANMHWGQEYRMLPDKSQESLADYLVAAGVDLIIGSHPHVIQPSKAIINEEGDISHVVVYSLGNLISAMVAPNTDGGQMIKVILEKTGNQVKIKSVGYMLVYRYRERENGQLKHRVVPVSMAENIDYPLPDEHAIVLKQEVYQKMMKFTRSARAILDKHNQGVPEYKVRTGE